MSKEIPMTAVTAYWDQVARRDQIIRLESEIAELAEQHIKLVRRIDETEGELASIMNAEYAAAACITAFDAARLKLSTSS